VIGGGIGGLCAAIGLHRSGLAVTVYEQSPMFLATGAGLILWANAVKALQKLGIKEDSLDGERFLTCEIATRSERVLRRISMEALEQKLGAPSLALHRADLHRALISALPDDVVRSKKFVGLDQDGSGLTAYFADGSVERADLLVGADGINSAVRRILFPMVRPNYAGYAVWRGVVNTRGEFSQEKASEFWGCGTRFGMVPIGAKRIYWFATANVPMGRKLASEERKQELLQRFHGWRTPVEALINATPPEAILYEDIYDFAPLSSWSLGRVTLLGDAAHITTPSLGQGACQAVESSVSLARSLVEENDLNTALQRYEAERRPRTAWITTNSRRLGQILQMDNRWKCFTRDLAVQFSSPAVLQRELLQAAAYEI